MASISLFVIFVLSHLLLLHSAEEEHSLYSNCSPFHCGKFGIQLEWGGRQYDVIKISYTNTTLSTTRIKDPLLLDHLDIGNCESLTNLTFPRSPSPSISYEITSPNQTLFKCNHSLNTTYLTNFKKISCHDDYNIYYSQSNHGSPTSLSECSIIQLPQNEHPDNKDAPFSLLGAEFDLEVRVFDDCSSCHARGGLCDFRKEEDREIFYCVEKKGNESIHNRISGAFELVLKVLSITLLT